jgi:hypothetical protein
MTARVQNLGQQIQQVALQEATVQAELENKRIHLDDMQQQIRMLQTQIEELTAVHANQLSETKTDQAAALMRMQFETEKLCEAHERMHAAQQEALVGAQVRC